MDEPDHIKDVLEKTKEALKNKDSILLKDLSNRTIHSASAIQDIGSITIAVIVYSLSKIIERRDTLKIKNWDKFVRKFNNFIDLAIDAIEDNNEEKYQMHLMRARKAISSISPNIKPAIEEVIRKASINKASKIYDHGISLGQTAKILGISQWELTEYTGQSSSTDAIINRSLEIKDRAKMAMEFFT